MFFFEFADKFDVDMTKFDYDRSLHLIKTVIKYFGKKDTFQ